MGTAAVALPSYHPSPRPSVGSAAVAGLAGLRYEDNAAGGEIRTELAEEVLLRG